MIFESKNNQNNKNFEDPKSNFNSTTTDLTPILLLSDDQPEYGG